MGALVFFRWVLALVFVFYFYRALLGKLRSGDGLKAALAATGWLIISAITSGLVKLG